MHPKITVLTCVYNGLPYLEEAIDSVLNQTYSNFEYLIIDDASTDINVAKLIESYDDSRIRFIKNEKNLGVSNTFNRALELIDTTYVVRLDQDDVNLPDRIEKQINFLENNEDIDIVCSFEYVIDFVRGAVNDTFEPKGNKIIGPLALTSISWILLMKRSNELLPPGQNLLHCL